MNALLKKLTVLCLVFVLGAASWACNCKGKTGDDGKSEPAKTCTRSGDKTDEPTKTCKSKGTTGSDEKAGCHKGGSKDDSTENTG